ncbi:peptidoglycan-binding domain-containing protein [Streptomyces spiralis]
MTELQQRLAQLYLYTGRIDGVFGRRQENSVRAPTSGPAASPRTASGSTARRRGRAWSRRRRAPDVSRCADGRRRTPPARRGPG